MKPSDPAVSIVLATHNGARFLGDQLRSILAQTHQNWHIILSDDGSSDATLDIAREIIPENQLSILKGPCQGVALNFWNGLGHVPRGHFSAFCDQDDIWRPDKLERALEHLAQCNGPALYSAGRYVTDERLDILVTQRRRPAAGLLGTLLRNRVAGHTCVMSPDAVHLLNAFPPSKDVPFHDWWAALILRAKGAKFIHDPMPVLRYRQHGANVIGARGGRLWTLLSGRYFGWVNANLRALWSYRR